MRCAAMCLMLLLWGSSAWGMTGNDWNNYNESTNYGYILGLVNGWNFASLKDGCEVERVIRSAQYLSIGPQDDHRAISGHS
jgi:hypothetical protein